MMHLAAKPPYDVHDQQALTLAQVDRARYADLVSAIEARIQLALPPGSHYAFFGRLSASRIQKPFSNEREASVLVLVAPGRDTHLKQLAQSLVQEHGAELQWLSNGFRLYSPIPEGYFGLRVIVDTSHV